MNEKLSKEILIKKIKATQTPEELLEVLEEYYYITKVAIEIAAIKKIVEGDKNETH